MKPVSTKDLKLYEPKKEEDFNGGPLMSLTDHLDELRNKIIISLIALGIGTFAGFTLSKEIINFLTKIAPAGTSFLQIKPGEFFFTSLRVAFYTGFVTALPVVLWQLAGFILPGLNLTEKKISFPIIIASPLLFLMGSMFAYFFVAPSMLNFLFGFGKDVISMSISIENYVSFTLMIMAICGVAFLLPILLISLAGVGIVNSSMLFAKWRHAVLVSILLGAVLTPTPDPFNMMLVAGIIITLYFLSCGILKILRN